MEIDFLTAEGRWFSGQQLVERKSAGFGDEVVSERWITKDGKAIFIAAMGDDPPETGEIAGSPEEHQHAATAHKNAMDAMSKVGDKKSAEMHRVAMLAHQKAAEAVAAANDASKHANFGHHVFAGIKGSDAEDKPARKVVHSTEPVAGRIAHAAAN